MQDQFDSSLTNQAEETQRPKLLKVLCILSFVLCGLWIIVFLFGWLICLNLNVESVSEVWGKVLAAEPRLEGVDAMMFFGEVGKLCLYFLLANIVSLVGVSLMWRLNRIGFFIYIAAELITNFFSLNIEIPSEQKSYMGLILYLAIDTAFIVLYAMNLKHMKKGSN